MQVKRVNENTMRVNISKDELSERGFELLDMIKNREKVQEFFYSILEEVDTDHSFAQNGAVSFQVMPNHGGLDLLITKINPNSSEFSKLFNDSSNNEVENAFSDLPTENSDANDRRTEIVDDEEHDELARQAYRFGDLGILVELADSLKVSDLASSLYYFKGAYYLEVAFLDDNYAELKPEDAWAIINEYGFRIENSEMKTVKNIGKCILRQDALGNLRYYFNK